MLTRIWKMAERLDHRWQGDLLGVICLFGAGYCALLLGYGAGL